MSSKKPEGKKSAEKKQSEIELKKIPIVTIDLSQAWDTESAIDIIIETVEKIFPTEEAMFCVFESEGEKIKNVLQKKEFFASTKLELRDYEGADSAGFYIKRAMEKRGRLIDPALVVYDASKLQQQKNAPRWEINENSSPRGAILMVCKFIYAGKK